MTKSLKERLWHLREYYGRGGWHPQRLDGFKKYRDIHARLLKDGLLEKDPEQDLYRCTVAGHAALKEAEL